MINVKHYSEIKSWKWKHFTPKEMACNGTGELLISEDLLNRLEIIRDKLKKPLIINSAYRSPAWNARNGGAPLSRHKFGDAVDISTSNGVKKEDLIAIGKSLGFCGIGHIHYKSWCHLDLRVSKYIIYW